MNRLHFSVLSLLTLMLIPISAQAHCKGNHSGDHPHCTGDDPPPPPTGCADTFPGFLYQVEETRKAPAELRLASSDACRKEIVEVMSENFRASAFHMTADGSQGVILWTEDINNQYIVRRLDFTVDNSGNLEPGDPVTVLPLTGEEALPGNQLFYFSMDIWGTATHDSLVLTVLRTRSFNSGPNAGEGIKEALIYDLNALVDVNLNPYVRLIWTRDTPTPQGAGDWQDAIELDCSSVLYPQFVPTCYDAEELRFNPSGTRLYIQHNINDSSGQRWDAALRINIDKSIGPDLDKWTLNGPEMVYTGTTEFEPSGTLARPGSDSWTLPSPEFIGMNYYDRSGNQTVGAGAFLNADQCATLYAPLSGGNVSGSADLWLQQCVANQLLNGTGNHSWQSSDAFLTSSLGKRHYDVYRRHASGGSAGTEELLIENGRFPDTGL